MLFCLEVYLLLLEVLADDYLDLIWTFLVHSLLVGVIFKVSFESIPSSSDWLIVWTSMWLFAFTVAFFWQMLSCCLVRCPDYVDFEFRLLLTSRSKSLQGSEVKLLSSVCATLLAAMRIVYLPFINEYTL